MLLTCAVAVHAQTAPAPAPKSTPTLTITPIPTLTPTPSKSTATSTTATKKPANTGEIYRWVDSQGKVQYSADVPEDRRSTARKVDTRGNIVSSRVPARITAPAPTASASSDAASTARPPVTEREKCEAAWQQYRQAEACFAQYRQGISGGSGRKAGSVVSAEAFEKCPSIAQPEPCR